MVSDARAPVLGDRYELGPLIGQGGMGRVFRAHDRRLSRDVAVKMVAFGAHTDRSARERLEHEALTSARINHPNVVAVYDVGEHDGELFIVMESLPGRTLADQLRAERLPADRVVTLAAELLGGLAAAHDRGVLHRDIKPDNVMFAADGSAKLGDFGIAKIAESADLTATGQIIGTARYLPPERLDGRPATAAGDQYSLAVVLYEALTGRCPFTGDTPVAVAHSIATTTPVPITELVPDADPVLAAAIERAMSRDPAQRFASVAAFAAALGPDSTPPTAVSHAGAAATTTTLAGPLATRALPLAPAHVDGPHPARRRARVGVALAATVAGLAVIAGVAFGLRDRGSGTPPTSTATTLAVTSTTTIAPTTVPPTTPRPATTKGHGPKPKPKHNPKP